MLIKGQDLVPISFYQENIPYTFYVISKIIYTFKTRTFGDNPILQAYIINLLLQGCNTKYRS